MARGADRPSLELRGPHRQKLWPNSPTSCRTRAIYPAWGWTAPPSDTSQAAGAPRPPLRGGVSTLAKHLLPSLKAGVDTMCGCTTCPSPRAGPVFLAPSPSPGLQHSPGSVPHPAVLGPWRRGLGKASISHLPAWLEELPEPVFSSGKWEEQLFRITTCSSHSLLGAAGSSCPPHLWSSSASGAQSRGCLGARAAEMLPSEQGLGRTNSKLLFQKNKQIYFSLFLHHNCKADSSSNEPATVRKQL